MGYTIYRELHVGIGTLIIELIITMICLDIGENLHPAMRLLIKIGIAIFIFAIFSSSKIGCVIVSLFYSVIWSLLLGSIINEFSHGDKIWILVIGGITFLVSLIIHLSSMNDSGCDYVITKVDDH